MNDKFVTRSSVNNVIDSLLLFSIAIFTMSEFSKYSLLGCENVSRSINTYALPFHFLPFQFD